MKKGKTALFVTILIVAVCALLYFFPVNTWIGKLPLVSKFYNNTSIEIFTRNCTAKVAINGKEYGETPLTIDDLPEGEYTITLDRISADENVFYERHTFTIELPQNTTARLDLEIGPTDTMQGAVLYYTPMKVSSENGFLMVTPNVNNANIYIDTTFTQKGTISNLELPVKEYKVNVTADGYESVEIPVLVRKGYLLNLKTFHFPIPVILDETKMIAE